MPSPGKGTGRPSHARPVTRYSLRRAVRGQSTLRGTWRAALGAATVACAAALAIGCGADEEPPARPLAVPKARETPLAALRDLRAIVKARDCDRMAGRWHTANGALDEGTCFYLFRQLGAIDRPVVSARGTGLAVSFAAPGGDGRRSAVMALDTSRTWRLLMVLDIDRGPIPDPAEVDRRARATLDAIADDNCLKVVALAHRDIGIAAAGSPEQRCQQVLTSDLALALSVRARYRLQPQGRGRNFTIYALDLGESGYFTVLMARTPLKRVPGRPVVQRFTTAVRAR